MKNIRLKWRVEKNDILFFLAMAPVCRVLVV